MTNTTPCYFFLTSSRGQIAARWQKPRIFFWSPQWYCQSWRLSAKIHLKWTSCMFWLSEDRALLIQTYCSSVWYCTISNGSAVTRHRLSGCGRSWTFVPSHTRRWPNQKIKFFLAPQNSLFWAVKWTWPNIKFGWNFILCHTTTGRLPKFVHPVPCHTPGRTVQYYLILMHYAWMTSLLTMSSLATSPTINHDGKFLSSKECLTTRPLTEALIDHGLVTWRISRSG